MTKTFIFDFDGTIADSFEDTINILHSISKYTLHNLSKTNIINEIKNKHIKEIIKDFNLSKFQILILIWKIRKELKKNKSNLKPIDSMKEVLNKLHALGYNLVLITSNTSTTVSSFLERENLCIFSEIYYKSGLFSKNKIINKLIKKNNLDKKQVYYIGDEIRDIICAKKSNINSISVTWGYNSRKLLEKENPKYIIDSPKSLLFI